MTLRIPLGIDDFRKLRESELTYVDKTRLVCDILDLTGIEVLLPSGRIGWSSTAASSTKWRPSAFAPSSTAARRRSCITARCKTSPSTCTATTASGQ